MTKLGFQPLIKAPFHLFVRNRALRLRDAVSLNGGRALIGASGDRDLGWGAGAAYLFDRLQAPARSRLVDSGFERDPCR